MKFLSIFVLVCTLAGCVSGAPKLTSEQFANLNKIQVIKKEDSIEKAYTELSKISAADCSGAPYGGRVWGDAEKAIETLKVKAAALNADAVAETSCSAAPLVNNCWAAKLCTGVAIKWNKT